MKIRNGFVSNSSSSSFMIAIGVVSDWNKFSKWFEEVVKLIEYKEDLSVIDPNYHDDTINSGDHWSVVGHVNSEPEVFITKEAVKTGPMNIPHDVKAKNLLLEKGDGNVVVFNIGNDEGDSCFATGPEYDLKYDIDLDWFSENQRKIYTGFSEENGISHVDKTFGAGRNG